MEKSVFLKKHNVLLVGSVLRGCDQAAGGPASRPRVSGAPPGYPAGLRQGKMRRNDFFSKDKKKEEEEEKKKNPKKF